jgi:hypothetical protein
MRAWLILGGVLLVAVPSARADILVWRDADGVRHYTNRADAVPSDLTPEIVIRGDGPAEAPVPAVAAAAPATAVPAPVVASDAMRLEEAYRAGLSAGLNLGTADDGYARGGGGGGGAAAGGTVEIIGPLAVANARSTDQGWGPYYGWPGGYFPFVTTGFDRGRSRHQTLRMLLQDQFAIDRDGPYAYHRWDQPGVGPALAPFLPRGLPLPIQQYGRVLYR